MDRGIVLNQEQELRAMMCIKAMMSFQDILILSNLYLLPADYLIQDVVTAAWINSIHDIKETRLTEWCV